MSLRVLWLPAAVVSGTYALYTRAEQYYVAIERCEETDANRLYFRALHKHLRHHWELHPSSAPYRGGSGRSGHLPSSTYTARDLHLAALDLNAAIEQTRHNNVHGLRAWGQWFPPALTTRQQLRELRVQLEGGGQDSDLWPPLVEPARVGMGFMPTDALWMTIAAAWMRFFAPSDDAEAADLAVRNAPAEPTRTDEPWHACRCVLEVVERRRRMDLAHARCVPFADRPAQPSFSDRWAASLAAAAFLVLLVR